MLEFSHESGRVKFFILPDKQQVRFKISGADDAFHLDATIPIDDSLLEPGGRFDEVLSYVLGEHGPEAQQIKSVLLLARASLFGPKAEDLLRQLSHWLIASNEKTNFTYKLRPLNERQAMHLVSLVCAAPFDQVQSIMAELDKSADMVAHMRNVVAGLSEVLRQSADLEPRFGRRKIWYAIARILKPRLIVETGVDQGLGSMLLCHALAENAKEGHPGRYLGTDKREDAGQFLTDRYAEFGELLIGDSLESISTIEGPVDLFINDSDHSAEYEAKEYEAIAPKLSSHAVILGDNAHSTSKLDEFALATNRQFAFFREQSIGHWYPGAGVGVAWFPGRTTRGQK